MFSMLGHAWVGMGILKNQCENRAFTGNGFKINHAVIRVNNSVNN